MEKQCDFTSCGDKQGVFAWMGTKKGTAEWANPSTIGEVEVCCSSTESGSAEMLVDAVFGAQTLQTKNEVNSWMGVDLKTAEACPSIYCMAPGAAKNNVLRSWIFEGSKDGLTWETLDDRTDDATMSAEAPHAAYAITPTTNFFRFFRIKLKPQGNDSKNDTLCLSCFEIYGKAKPMGGGAPAPMPGAGGGGMMMGGGGKGPAFDPQAGGQYGANAAGLRRGGELRVSPKNGRCYDLKQFVTFFGGTPDNCPAWNAAQPAPPGAQFGSNASGAPREPKGGMGMGGPGGPMGGGMMGGGMMGGGMMGMGGMGGMGAQPERRIDSADGLAYTYEQFQQQYGPATPAKWASSPVAQIAPRPY